MAERVVGVLAEDRSDCDAIAVLVRRMLAEKGVAQGQYKLHARADEGCAKLRRKAEPWMRELARRGCQSIILLHDRDRHEETQLRTELSALSVPAGVQRLICIPVEELEAWFFASEKALRLVCGEHARRQVHPSPHLIRSPKERLRALSQGDNRKPRHSPNDNARLAEELELEICARRCQAFAELRTFVHGLL